MLLTPLRPYQQEAVERALPHDGFAFWIEQRAGKTLTSLALVDKRKPDLLVIVTVPMGKPVWEEQLAEHLKITWKCQVILRHFREIWKERKKLRQLLRNHGPEGVFIICDESHKIKRRGSQASRVVRSLGKLSQWRLALTGTPIAPKSRTKKRRNSRSLSVSKGLEDAWSQFDFVDPSIYGDWESFAERYLKYGGFRNHTIVGYRNEEKFQRLFHKYSYRKLLRDVQEKGKRTIIRRKKVYFELSSDARKVYDELDTDMCTAVNGIDITVPLVVTLSQKLQQVTGGFIIDAAGNPHRVGSGKVLALRTVLGSIFSQDHRERVVVCARFTPEIRYIEHMARRMKLSYQTIADGQQFNGKFKQDLIILQIASGAAIDLAAADSMVFFSLNHSHFDYEQSRFRILSYSKRRINLYYLIARNTIDELMFEAATKKKDLTTLVLDYYRKRDRRK